MKLLSKDIPADALLERIQQRLQRPGRPAVEETPEARPAGRVDPTAFHLGGLEANADPTRPLPLQSHRAGAGRLVLVAKWAFRKTCQVFINEALGRQRLFNGHVRDGYAQLSAELVRLREEVERLKAGRGPGT